MKFLVSKLKAKVKKYKFLLSLAVSLLTFLSFNSNYAFAVGDAYFPQDTTVNLTIDGTSTNFTIVGESEANEITVDTSSITVNISGGQTFKIKSSGGNKLTNDGGLIATCSGGESSLTVTVSSTKNVIISPGAPGCTSSSGGGGSPGGSAGGNTSTATATPTPTPSSGQTSPTIATAKPGQYNLKDGDVVSASGSDDPDIYIVNVYGYKRLFLNPVIFNFYGHLGGFSKVKNIASTTRNVFPTSGLFRNCETNDPKVYGVEVTGEDVGMLHWVNTTGAQAVIDDPEFFKKVFCINNNEFAWYKKGTAYTSVNQIPLYSRTSTSSSSPSSTVVVTSGKIKVLGTVAWLNVRDSGSTSGKVIEKVLPGQEFTFVDFKNNWYKIQKDGKDFGWVFGVYVVKL